MKEKSCSKSLRLLSQLSQPLFYAVHLWRELRLQLAETSAWLPCVLTGISIMPRMTVLPTATMGPIGLFAGCFLEPAPGFTALTAFSAMSTTAMILITVTLDRCRSGERSASTTSGETRRGMDEAT